MKSFTGFPEGAAHHTQIPDLFFEQLLPQIEDLEELKATLFFFHLFDDKEGAFRFVRRSEFVQDPRFMRELGEKSPQAESMLDEALNKAVERGTLLQAELEIGGKLEICYFLNSPRGRAAIRAIQNGEWQMVEARPGPSPTTQPNIFQLYETHIGLLTPLIADELGEAQETYPAGWIEEAMLIAAKKNKRTWRYVLAILDRWQREGHHDREEKSKNRGDSPEARHRYIQGEFSEHIEH